MSLRSVRIAIFVVVTVVIAAAVFFAAFRFFQGLAPSKAVVLKYWGLWEPESVLASLIEKYQAQNPNVTVEYELQTPRDYRERLQARIAAGTGPDIFRFHNTWVPMLKNELGILPSEIMDRETFEGAFWSVHVRDLQAENGFYGVPLGFDGLAMYYNEDLLSAAGINSIPANWDQLRVAAATLTVRDESGQIKTSGASLGTASNVDHFSDIVALMMVQNGVNLASAITGNEQTDRLATDALDFYTLFATSGESRTWDETLENSTSAFAAGRVAFYFAPSWRAFEIKAANPSLNFRIAPVPQLLGAQVNLASYWVEGVSAKSPNQKQAWEFLKFLASEESQRQFYSAAAKLRLFGEPPSRFNMASSFSGDPFLAAYLSQAPTAVSFPAASNTFDNGLNDRIVNFFKDAVTAVNRGTGSKQALQTLTAGINQVFTQFGITPQTTR